MTTKLVCPECDAGFKVPAAAIPEEGRTVRCAKCKHEWLATPEHLVTTEEPSATTEAPTEAPIAEPVEDDSVAKIEAEEATEKPPQEPTEEVKEDASETKAEDDAKNTPEDDDADDEENDAVTMAKSLKEAAALAKIDDINPKKANMGKGAAKKSRFTLFLIIGSIAMTLLFVATALFSWHHSLRNSSGLANSIYNSMGYLDTNGIMLAKLEYNKIPMYNKTRYQIKGALVNTVPEEKAFPTLRMRIVDAKGKTIKIREGKLDGTLKYGEPFHFSEEFDGSALSKDHALIVEIGNKLELSDRE